MNIGKLIVKHGEYFVRDLASDDLHHVADASTLVKGEYYAFEINEDDDAVDLVSASDALLKYGIQASTGSFYTEAAENEDGYEDAESFFGTCELTGMRGDIVPCMYLDTDGNVVRVNAGTWLVHSVLGKLAGAF